MRVTRIRATACTPHATPGRPPSMTPLRACAPLWRSGVLGLSLLLGPAAAAAEPQGFLETLHRHSLLTSTVPDNGDQNPYAIVVAPVSAGKIRKDDVLVDNFNDQNNLQGLGTTIVAYTPATKKLALFAAIPRHLAQCPGGVGLTTAMTMLQDRLGDRRQPAEPGRHHARRKGQGCLIVLDAQGAVAGSDRRAEHQRPLGQHGGDRQRRHRDAVRQQHRLRCRPAGRRAAGADQGDRAAPGTGDRRRQAARW